MNETKDMFIWMTIFGKVKIKMAVSPKPGEIFCLNFQDCFRLSMYFQMTLRMNVKILQVSIIEFSRSDLFFFRKALI